MTENPAGAAVQSSQRMRGSVEGVETSFKSTSPQVVGPNSLFADSQHEHQAQKMIRNLQDESRSQARAEERRTMEHPVWGGPGWEVLLDDPDEIRRTILYIDDNPIKAGRPRQSWRLVAV